MKTAIYRKERFNAAHRLFCSDWDEEKNLEVFGKCANPNYHGHNYELIVRLAGEVDPITGYVYDLKKLSDLVALNVLEILDHKNLNQDLEYFAKTNPTVENIAKYIYELLRNLIDARYDLKITLYETERNFAEYPAS